MSTEDRDTASPSRGITVMLSGITDTHGTILETLGVGEHLRRAGLVFPDTPAAIRQARELIHVHLRGHTAQPKRPGSRDHTAECTSTRPASDTTVADQLHTSPTSRNGADHGSYSR